MHLGIHKNLVGERYQNLVVIRYVGKTSTRHSLWECKCDCGNTIVVAQPNLRKQTSCGCTRKKRKEPLTQVRLYRIWTSMKTRCFNPNATYYHNYGGRGITVCDEWKNDFKSFYDWSMSNGYADNLTIDRIDNDRNYEPDNCQWITKSENSKKSNIERKLKKERIISL